MPEVSTSPLAGPTNAAGPLPTTLPTDSTATLAELVTSFNELRQYVSEIQADGLTDQQKTALDKLHSFYGI